MKNVITVMLFAVVFANLTGCASVSQPTKYNLSETEQQQIKDGHLVKFADKRTHYQEFQSAPIKLDKSKITKGVFVCATPSTTGDVCYPHLSNTVANYLSKHGVKLAQKASDADEILYFSLGYDYAPVDDASNQRLMEELDKSISKKNGLVLDKITARDKSNDGRNNLLVGLGLAIIAAKAGGATPAQTANGVSFVADNSYHPGKQAQTNQVMNILLCAADPQGKQSSRFARGEYHIYNYHGPKPLEAAFPVLFDEALKETVADIVMN